MVLHFGEYTGMRKGLGEKVTRKQIREGGERVSQIGIWQKKALDRKNSPAGWRGKRSLA